MVRESMSERAKQAGAQDIPLVVNVCERAVYKHFHEQGLIQVQGRAVKLLDLAALHCLAGHGD